MIQLIRILFLISTVYTAQNSSSSSSSSSESNETVCDCRDWYGRCKLEGAEWVDESVWQYKCNSEGQSDIPSDFIGCIGTEGKNIAINKNQTNGEGFWEACDADEKRLRYERELHCLVNGTKHHVGEEFREGIFQWLCRDSGRWVIGCYYKNETGNDVLLPIGASAYNGLVKHVCDRYVDYPGRVQYYTQIRDDVHVKHPTNKGENKNLPEGGIKRIEGKVQRWLHENAEAFIANTEQDSFRARIRYLPASRRQWGV